ncbi:MAG: hypothetical protein F6J93_35035 [Oscillatoria sp. SIO1A7]|nr:hypothetical protein [Oscillatoria sp. SIO1A7]
MPNSQGSGQRSAVSGQLELKAETCWAKPFPQGELRAFLPNANMPNAQRPKLNKFKNMLGGYLRLF